jgi:hypothetical protein
MSHEVSLREDAIRLAFAQAASARLTPVSLARFTVLLGRNAENDQDRQIADTFKALPMNQVSVFMTESSSVGKRLRAIAPFDVLLAPDEMTMIASHAEDLVYDQVERLKQRQIDDLVTGTVNAATVESVTADQIATWIRDSTTDDALARNALSTFFLEVPLGTQVAFLDHHGLDEEKALGFATEIEVLGRSIPLQQRSRW